jgi:hypothetical protein
MQSFLSEIIAPLHLEDMGQKELSAQLEKVTGRVTSLEKEFASIAKNVRTNGWNTDRLIAFGSLLVSIIGVPVMLIAWLEPHLHNDLINDGKIEVANQLKEPLKQIGEIAGDLKEI